MIFILHLTGQFSLKPLYEIWSRYLVFHLVRCLLLDGYVVEDMQGKQSSLLVFMAPLSSFNIALFFIRSRVNAVIFMTPSEVRNNLERKFFPKMSLFSLKHHWKMSSKKKCLWKLVAKIDPKILEFNIRIREKNFEKFEKEKFRIIRSWLYWIKLQSETKRSVCVPIACMVHDMRRALACTQPGHVP